jgi:hypothetical protein
MTVACIPEVFLSNIIAQPFSFLHCPTTSENVKAAAEALSDPLYFNSSWGGSKTIRSHDG